MKLLAFSDLHRDVEQARRLAQAAADADVVIAAGDFASFRRGLGPVIDALSAIARPTLLVPGNHETEAALRRACEGWDSAIVLHGEAREIDGVAFFGLGAAVPPAPFPLSFDLTEEQATAALADCPPGAVLVVHSPPRGHLDEARGRHLGSRSVLETIERQAPPLVLCGHIHECWGQESRIGPSRVLNLGPAGTQIAV
jgi:Icc-related predicted phosphoesterase